MKLYHQPRTRSSRVRWLLAELGVTCDVAPIDVFAGEGRKPDYQQAVHPHGFVPALEEDGQILIESSAICMYLADRYGEGRLAPKLGTAERGKYYEWMVYVPATVDPCLETIMFHTVFLPEGKRIPQLVERAKKSWTTKMEPRIEAALAKSPFILGETFSAADVLVGGALAWAQMAGVLGSGAAITRYLDAITKRPAFVAGHTT
ncbi:MAG: glutathione S-transferase family protein [Labilithrix sp.]|nr:glutathione S-transferase family protein [Labilithrix sp.]